MSDFDLRSATDEQAAFWFLRLRDADVRPEEIEAALDWQEECPANREAFARIERMWTLAVQIPRPPLPALSHEASNELRQIRPWPVAAAAVLLIAVAGFIGVRLSVESNREPRQVASGAVRDRLSPVTSVEPAPTRYSTPPGENRTIDLDDGSEVVMGGGSAISVRYSASVRRISLSAGEALFRVHKNPARPFIVESDGGETLAVGTVFDVRRGPEDVTVTVIEGVVRVQSDVLHASSASMVTAQLAAGHQVIYSPKGTLGPISQASAKRATSWQQGELTFIDRRLSDVVVDLNRYSPEPIILRDEDAKTIRVTGVVTVGKIGAWLRALEKNLPIRIIEGNRQITLVGRDDASATDGGAAK